MILSYRRNERKRGKPGFSVPYPSEERLEGLIQPAENIWQQEEFATPSNPAARIGFNWLAWS